VSEDAKAIRDLVGEWLPATAEHSLDRVLSLMDEDVVFLTPGGPPPRFGRFG